MLSCQQLLKICLYALLQITSSSNKYISATGQLSHLHNSFGKQQEVTRSKYGHHASGSVGGSSTGPSKVVCGLQYTGKVKKNTSQNRQIYKYRHLTILKSKAFNVPPYLQYERCKQLRRYTNNC